MLRRSGLAVAPAAVRACRPRPNRTPGSAAKDHDAIPTPDDKSREDIGPAAEDVSADALISFDGVWQLGPHRGPQRAGKTTLLRIATGILAPDAGTVTIDGLHSHRNWREYHRRLGFYRPGIGSVCTVQRARPPDVHHAAGVHAPVATRAPRSTTRSCGSRRAATSSSAGQIDCLRASASGLAWRPRSCTRGRSVARRTRQQPR